jgi:hypothetical protein
MRRLFWCGGILALAVAASGGWIAARSLSACGPSVAEGIWRVAEATNPLARASYLVGRTLQASWQMNPSGAISDSEMAPCAPCELIPLESPPTLASLPPGATATDASAADEDGTGPCPECKRAGCQNSNCCQAAQVKREHLKMPRCQDEDDDVPATMPYAAESEAAVENDCVAQFWMGLFRKSLKENGTAEESETVQTETPPKCQEDPSYHQQYPGCPYSGVCPYSGKSAGPGCCDDDCCTKGTCPKAKSKKKAQHHPRADTMESRPSDTKPAGGENVPF